MLPRFDAVLFWNTLFDKGVLAAILVGVGYFANRLLEQFRSEMALSTEGAKIRLARIGELWEELNLREADAKRLFIRLCRAMLDELRAADVRGVPAAVEGESAPDVLVAINGLTIPSAVLDRLAAKLPNSKELADRGYELLRKLDQYRFWLKDDLHRAMKQYHIEMEKAAATLELSPEGIVNGRKAFFELSASRHDVDEIIDRLISRSRARAALIKSKSRAT
jgi:hypothetical protein